MINKVADDYNSASLAYGGLGLGAFAMSFLSLLGQTS